MKLRKILSGGQTGANEAGLECARALGLETGGTAPKGYKTENGPNLKLRDVYGLKESHSSNYDVRTKQNVLDADITIWFGNTSSPGFYCTKKAAEQLGRPFVANVPRLALEYYANAYGTWNVAGNRASKNRLVTQSVHTAFGYIAELLEKHNAGNSSPVGESDQSGDPNAAG